MKKSMRLLAFLLSLCLLVPCLVACSGTKQEQKVIGTCAGYDVLYEELRYLTLTYKDIFEATYGEGIWSSPETAEQYRRELEDTVWRLLVNNYAVLAACGHHMGVEETKKAMKDDDIVAAVDEQLEEVIASYGSKKEFQTALKENYLTEHFWSFTLTVAQLENELLYVMSQDLGLIEDDTKAFYDWLNDGNCVYVQHLFVSNDKGEDVEANRQKAEDIRRQLLEGDAEELVMNMMNDTELDEDLSNLNPYYVVRDVYTLPIEEAAFSLDEAGDVSDVIEVETGFYVLVRIEDNDQTRLSMTPSLLSSYQWAKLEAEIDTFKKDLTVELNEYGKSIDLLTIE